MAGTAFPVFRAHFADAHLVGAGRQFKSQFRLAFSEAVRSGVYTAIRFERREDGTVWYAVYTDGDEDGVLTADIRSGRDRLVSGPYPLSGGRPACGWGSTRLPAPPPDHGLLSGDPVRFGRSDLLSFSPWARRPPGPSTWRATPPSRGSGDRRQRPRAAHGLARRALAREVNAPCRVPTRVW